MTTLGWWVVAAMWGIALGWWVYCEHVIRSCTCRRRKRRRRDRDDVP